MADAKDETSTTDRGSSRSVRNRPSVGAAEVRTRVAQAVWIICVVFALFLAVGALLVALGNKVNEENAIVSFVLDWANRVDLGVFSIDGGVWESRGKNSQTRNALVNWGMGAVFWLVLGRILDRVIRP